MFSKRLIAVAVAAAGFATASCSKDSPTDPLAYVPASTPYLLANLEPVPAASIDMWMKNAEQMVPMYEKMIDGMLAEAAAGDTPADAKALRIIKALREELKGKINRAGLESLGWSMSARTAVYGIGLIPVMRVELADPDAFRAFVARMEGRVGEKLTVAKVGEQEYWSAGGSDEKLQAVVALQGKHLVMTLAPKTVDDKVMEQLLGLELPEQSALDADVLEGFNKERGYLPYGSGYLDTGKFLSAVFGQRSPAEQAFLDSIGEKNPAADVSEVCKTEAQSIAAQVPRLSFGYTQLEAKSMDIRYVLETHPAVGADLAKLAVVVPGLDGRGEGLFDVGFGMDLNALVAFINAKSSAVAASPYQCEGLKELNDAFAKARADLANPGIFMAASALKGFNASISKFESPEGAMPVVEGKLALASDNPASLLSMAGSFTPALANFTVQPNQAPVALPEGVLPPGVGPGFIAMTDKALGIAIGSDQQASLPAFLAGDAKTASPILHYGVDGNGMATFFDMMLKQSESALAAAEAMQAMNDETAISDESPETSDEGGDGAAAGGGEEARIAELRAGVESMKAVRDMYVQSIARADFAVYATSRGIEAGYALQMK